MFIGHYGVALAIRKKEPRLPLWALILAVQWVDVMFCVFVLTGIEALRIVPGFTAYNPFDLYHMPYTHSLLGSALWALGMGGIGVLAFRRGSRAVAGLFWAGALAVFSHWLLDVPMHTPDMQLTFSPETKVGLGLWNNVAVSMALEVLCFGIGYAWLGWYRSKRYLVFGVVMLVLAITTFLQPPPAGPMAFAASALVGYLLLAAFGYWVERGRERG